MYKKIFFCIFCIFIVFPAFAATKEKSDYSELFLFPEDTRIFRKAAEIALKKQDLTRAVIFLEQLTELFPEEKKLWLDLADAYLRLGNKHAAQYATNMGKNTDEINDFKINTSFEAGAFYDDNIFFRNGKNSMRFGKGTLDLLDKEKKWQEKETSWGGYAQADFFINKQLMQTPFSFITDINVFTKQYNKSTIQNLQINTLSGIHYDTSSYTMAAYGVLEYFKEDSKNDLMQYGLQPMLSIKLSDLHLTTNIALLHSKYSENNDMDAIFFRLGQNLTFFNPKGSFTFGGYFFANLGQKIESEGKQKKLYDYNGWQALVSLRYNFFDNFQCLLNMSYENRQYQEPALVLLGYYDKVIFNEKRHDIKTALSLKLRYFFTKTIGLEGSYDGIHNESNTNTYDYVQNVFGLGMLFQF